MKVIVVAVLALFAFSAFASALLSEKELENLFVSWTHKHNKAYTVDEFQYRWQVWKSNARFIENFNKQGNTTFTVAMNKFGDLTLKEFNKMYKGLKHVAPKPRLLNEVVMHHPMIPASVDWRTKGAVTGIKNQGQCGSCWSFSTTGSTEGAHFLQARKTLVGLSEQNLVDCSQAEGNEGCNGGLMDDAFKYIISNNGIDSEASYPYTAEDGTCQFNAANVAATLVSYQDVTAESEPALTTAVAERGPVSVAIDASHESFQFYSGGVYYEPECSATQLDHGVLAVGYGAEGSSDYYIVKNSWGTDWGLSGYIWMSRNKNNNCGIATMASYPCAVSACMPQ